MSAGHLFTFRHLHMPRHFDWHRVASISGDNVTLGPIVMAIMVPIMMPIMMPIVVPIMRGLRFGLSFSLCFGLSPPSSMVPAIVAFIEAEVTRSIVPRRAYVGSRAHLQRLK